MESMSKRVYKLKSEVSDFMCIREDQRKTEWCKLRLAKHVCLNMLDVFAPLLWKDECKCFHLKWQNMDSFICNSSEHVRAHFINYIMCS